MAEDHSSDDQAGLAAAHGWPTTDETRWPTDADVQSVQERFRLTTSQKAWVQGPSPLQNSATVAIR